MFVVAVAGCDVEPFDGVDAAAPSVDGGVDGGVDLDVLVAAVPDVAHEVQDPPSLVDLTGISGRLGMVVGKGYDEGFGRVTRDNPGSEGPAELRRGHRPSESEQAMIGKPLRLYNRDGSVCAATVTGFVEMASIWPDAETRLSNRALWEVSEERSGVIVVAELSETSCSDPIFADDSDGAEPAPIAAAPIAAAPDVTEAALDRLRALPRFAAAQAEYLADKYHYELRFPDWSQDAERVVTVVTEFTLGGTAYVTAEVRRDGYCGDFGATVFAVWQRRADGSHHLVLDSEDSPVGYDLAFDTNRDGIPELAVTSELEPVYEAVDESGCGC